jgi:hypothetical protein
MPSSRIISIATAVSVVALFAGFVWWNGKAAKPTVPLTQPAAAARKISLTAVEAVPPLRRMTAPAAELDSAKAGEKPSDIADKPSKLEALPALPVLVHFYRRMRDPDQRLEGSIENTSNDALSIILNVLSAQTRMISRSNIDVPSQSRVVFGRDDGLNLGAGDQITLQSESYGDLVQAIR